MKNREGSSVKAFSKMPRVLYKYRNFSVNTLNILRSHEVYYADPRTFNDPLDSNPNIKADISQGDLEKLYFATACESLSVDEVKGLILRYRYESTEYGDYRSDARAQSSYQNRLISEIVNLLRFSFHRKGILSLASRPSCPLMWSHYGDEHRGLCIGFDVSDAKFGSLESVSYGGSRTLLLSDFFDWKCRGSAEAEQRIFQTVFLTKARQWRYEREWRDIAPDSGLKPSPALICSVHFGYRCDEVVMQTVVRLLMDAEFSVKFYVSRPANDNFAIHQCRIKAEDIISYKSRLPVGWEFRDVFSAIVDDHP